MQVLNNSFSKFSRTNRGKLKKRINVFYELLVKIYGADGLILKATKLEALTFLRSKNLGKKVLGLQRIIFEDPTIKQIPGFLEIPAILKELEEHIANILARRSLEESIEQKINVKLQERHEEYIRSKTAVVERGRRRKIPKR